MSAYRHRQYKDDNNNDDDGNESMLGELDSLLDSLGPTQDEDEHDDDDDDNDNDYEYSDDDEQHMVDTIDPDAVDFTPFLQNHSAMSVNYHSESNFVTEHHAILHRKTSGANSPFGRISPPTTPRELTTKTTTLSLLGRLVRLFRRQISSSSSGDDEPSDRMKYIIYGMIAFLFYVFYIHQSGSSSPMQGGKVVTKAHAPENTLVPPDVQEAYRDVSDLPIGIMDTPIYWHIPRSGGTTMKLIMSMCMGRVVACEQGAGHQLDEQLELLNKPFGNFANVDTSTPLGLQRAAELGLIPSRIVDVVLTPHVREASRLFDAHHKGRLFALFRHPVDRVVSLYYFLRMPDQEASIGLNVREMSLEQFAADISENWMVRSLTNTVSGPLTDEHLNIAKEILRTKFLIGLLDEKTESLRRIESYFGWKLPSRVSQTCKNNMFYFEPQSKNLHDQLDSSSKEYDALVQRNQHDVDLYEYAVHLFEEQQTLIPLK
eukprot:CAMPEP_0119015096 /NCGR_PEP_ID=MMETSP1176-20130426/10553_1 /TAXON_ID=265551 /ORGANISM="Synedropsis recta cf, Strain CCMP1620" /LENGTH=486 /DNA_ID=CAMNT_0006968363 /DNA_START=18 /DNA_END=1478 /DNA_ORIENTATION=-